MFAKKSKIQFEVVPIGYDCSISHFAREEGIRENAYPFDWNITPPESAVTLIENGFSDFLEEKNLVFLPPAKRMLFDEDSAALTITNEIITPVVCKKYHMLFPHDFSEKGKHDLSSVRDKYKRRITRLYELIRSRQKILFVYAGAKLNDWQIEQYSQAGLELHYADGGALTGLEPRLRKAAQGSDLHSLGELQEMVGPPGWMKRISRRLKHLVTPS